METRQTYNDFAKGALIFAILSLFGSLMSFINAIPLMIAYQLLDEARKTNLTSKQERLISILTLAITYLYFTLQF